MITIVDYSCGNPASIKNMLNKLGCSAEISSDPKVISVSDKLILPGVGSFDHGIEKLDEFGLRPILKERVLSKKVPILGICLGIHLFCKKSEEGDRPGLGWIDADVVSFDKKKMKDREKIPHMGWKDTLIDCSNELFCSKEEIPRYYYAHSYHLQCRDSSQVLARATYGYDFVSAIAKNNIFGVQFHPEKSHRFGMALLKNFIEKL